MNENATNALYEFFKTTENTNKEAIRVSIIDVRMAWSLDGYPVTKYVLIRYL